MRSPDRVDKPSGGADGQTGRRSAWWEEFFTALWLDFRLEAHTDEQTRLEADRIEELLQLPAQGWVLDVPCGEGRIAMESAARGYQLTGVDLAEPLLAAARRRAARQATGDHLGAAGHARSALAGRLRRRVLLVGEFRLLLGARADYGASLPILVKRLSRGPL